MFDSERVLADQLFAQLMDSGFDGRLLAFQGRFAPTIEVAIGQYLDNNPVAQTSPTNERADFGDFHG